MCVAGLMCHSWNVSTSTGQAEANMPNAQTIAREPSLDDSQTLQHCSGAPGAAPGGALQAQLAPATCAICLEAQQAATMHSLAGCGHRFCRECLRSYALAALAARLVPIMCEPGDAC